MKGPSSSFDIVFGIAVGFAIMGIIFSGVLFALKINTIEAGIPDFLGLAFLFGVLLGGITQDRDD